MRGCTNYAGTKYSPHCVRHLRSLRRHGHPEQRGISHTKLKPYCSRVRKLLRGSVNRERLEEALRQVAGSLLGNARAVVFDQERGVPTNRHEAQAARTLLNIFAEKDPLEVATTIAAMALLRDQEPRLFASDRSYVFEVARQFRAMSDATVVEHYNARTGDTKRVRREFPPRAFEILGKALIGAYGRFTAHVQNRAKQAEEASLAKLLDEAFSYEPSNPIH